MFVKSVPDWSGALANVSLFTIVAFTNGTGDFVNHVFSVTFVLESVIACVTLFVAGGARRVCES